jgi:3-oxoadipate enol-lactonase
MSVIAATAGYAPVQNGQLYYETCGEGDALVLIHAGIADCRMWDEQVASFARRYQVISYDARGFGRSKTEAVSFSNRQDLCDLLAHLECSKATVLGISRGGQIAIDFTLEHPELVRALIPVAAGLSGYQHQPTPAEASLQQKFEEMDALWEKHDFQKLVEYEMQVFVDGPGQPFTRVPATLRERVRAMDMANYVNQTIEPSAQPLDPPAAGRLAEIHVPALVIVGDLDTPSSQIMADLMVKGIAGARKVVFPGVAHMVNMEQPEQFNRVVLEFLGSL